jgi:hypothetical protein
MGRAAEVIRDDIAANGLTEENKAFEGADSHIANRGFEYIVFEPAQIVPVYVVHLDWGQDNAEYFMNLPQDPSNWIPQQSKLHPKLNKTVMAPGDRERAKAAVRAKAAKYFPYGYGPASGGRFVVEEVGEIDDDEEEYGDYQAMRGQELAEEENKEKSFWEWDDEIPEGDKARDQYWQQRRRWD